MNAKGRARAGLSAWAKAMRAKGFARGPSPIIRRPGQIGYGSSMGAALARVHTFKRVGTPLTITTSPAVGTAPGIAGNVDMIASGAQLALSTGVLANTHQLRGALRFALSQASAVQEIIDLFDNYRIRKVKLLFTLSYNSAPSSADGGVGTVIGASSLPLMHGCYDPDDSAVPNDRAVVLQNGYCRTIALNRSFTVTVTPRAQQSVVGGTGGAGGMLPTGTWLDTGSQNIYHYGYKFVLDDWPSSALWNMGLTITPTFYIEAKNVV